MLDGNNTEYWICLMGRIENMYLVFVQYSESSDLGKFGILVGSWHCRKGRNHYHQHHQHHHQHHHYHQHHHIMWKLGLEKGDGGRRAYSITSSNEGRRSQLKKRKTIKKVIKSEFLATGWAWLCLFRCASISTAQSLQLVSEYFSFPNF